MKNIYFITFLLISSILKIFSENGTVNIISVFLDGKETKINKNLEIKNSFDLQNTCKYNVENLLQEIKTTIGNIDEYSLYNIKSKDDENNEKNTKYNGYDDKILLYKNSTVKLYFEKKKQCNVVIHFNGKETNKDPKKSLLLKSDVNYEYLKYEIEKNFSKEKIKLDNKYYLSHIVKDKKNKLNDFNFKIEKDNCDIDIFINEYLKAPTKLNINNTEFEFVQLNIREKDLKNEATLLLLLYNNIKNIKDYEKLKNNEEYRDFLQKYSDYILYNVIKGDQNSDPKEYKNINFNDIKIYLQSNKNPSLTINIKSYIEINIIINNINNLIFNKEKLDNLKNLKKFKCKIIRNLKEKIIKDLEIKTNYNAMEIYKKENDEERICEDNELLVFDEKYIIKFSDNFRKKEKKKDSEKDSEKKDNKISKNKNKKKCFSSN